VGDEYRNVPTKSSAERPGNVIDAVDNNNPQLSEKVEERGVIFGWKS
jgi:hypothetical protein